MSRRLRGVGASAGRVMGPLRRVDWEIPRVPHRTIGAEEVEEELRRFHAARAAALERTRELRDRTALRLGEVEAKIFDPQSLMLEDPDLVDGTAAYIRENFLSAERAFEWRLMELRSRFLDSAHVMVLDRLSDLRDIRLRLLSQLLDRPELEVGGRPEGEEGELLSFDELTPSMAVRLEPERAGGILTARGSRASHSAVIARSLQIPAVVGVGDGLLEIEDGTRMILDGSTGRIVVEPEPEEVEGHRKAIARATARREHLSETTDRRPYTADGERVVLQINLDQPDGASPELRRSAEGVGLFRSEFLVIGRRTIPAEEEQYRAYRRVVEAFPGQEVTLRAFDLGGDKFPIFLDTPPEENPFLGWRAIRVCLDRPDLFRNQLRAALRASRHGNLRILIPFIISVDELRRTRELMREVADDLGLPEEERRIPLGAMIETPAAAETVDLLAPHVDFLSLGSNDLTQYVVAVDRGNARMADLYDALHPALFRIYARVREEAERHDLDLSVCGDIAADPVGAAALLGLGYRKFSLAPSAFPDVKEWIGSVSAGELTEICRGLFDCETAGEIRAPIRRYLEGAVPAETIPVSRLSPSR